MRCAPVHIAQARPAWHHAACHVRCGGPAYHGAVAPCAPREKDTAVLWQHACAPRHKDTTVLWQHACAPRDKDTSVLWQHACAPGTIDSTRRTQCGQQSGRPKPHETFQRIVLACHAAGWPAAPSGRSRHPAHTPESCIAVQCTPAMRAHPVPPRGSMAPSSARAGAASRKRQREPARRPAHAVLASAIGRQVRAGAHRRRVGSRLRRRGRMGAG